MGVSQGWRETCASLAYQGRTSLTKTASSVRLVAIRIPRDNTHVKTALVVNTLAQVRAPPSVRHVHEAKRYCQVEAMPRLTVSKSAQKDSMDQPTATHVFLARLVLTIISPRERMYAPRVKQERRNLGRTRLPALFVQWECGRISTGQPNASSVLQAHPAVKGE